MLVPGPRVLCDAGQGWASAGCVIPDAHELRVFLLRLPQEPGSWGHGMTFPRKYSMGRDGRSPRMGPG